MGEHEIRQASDDCKLRHFEQSLLRDMHAVEFMIEKGLFESDVVRIGAEQEMFLVDKAMRPACVSAKVLKLVNDPRVTTELAQFNVEANITPKEFRNHCLRELHDEIRELWTLVRERAQECKADVVLAGILPTLVISDLKAENLTQSPRYIELNRVLKQLRGHAFFVQIKGLDELFITHESMVLEACNTSFQIHLQTDPQHFANAYNVAQAITGPVLAASVNSPLLFHKRLWNETRLALFQQAVDDRSDTHQERVRPPRVIFGDHWIRESVLEIFHEDAARFRVLMTVDSDQNPFEILNQGKIPDLPALRLHNGTVWRWNRPCYGILNGRPHLRIESRAFPAGPTIIDEVANAALFFGLMVAMQTYFPPIHTLLHFDNVKENFYAAARHGLKAQFTFLGKSNISASDLILQEFLPLARKGLADSQIDSNDIDRYLGIIEDRVKTAKTGASWILQAYSQYEQTQKPDVKARLLVETMLENQIKGEPVHCWPVQKTSGIRSLSENFRKVEQFMSTDLFTVRPDDLIDLAASIMDWERIRHVPVEDDQGKLVGLISHRDLLHLVVSREFGTNKAIPVSEVMKRNPITVGPETSTLDAIDIMRTKQIGCLPVVRDERLIGIVTVQDLLALSACLLDEALGS